MQNRRKISIYCSSRAGESEPKSGGKLDSGAIGGYAGGDMKRLLCLASLFCLFCAPLASAGDVILTGGVALRSWEDFRGPNAHDNWWANFVRASTVKIAQLQEKNASARITWIVYRPAYLTRGKENKIDYVPKIAETAGKLKVKLVWVDTAEAAFKAIAAAGRAEKINTFTYFGHSNPHAFMLDYSNDIMAASTQWMHEKDIEKHLSPALFAPQAECWSYGCYTGQSMSGYWKRATQVPMWGNTESTRYQPVGEGKLPEGAGKWVQ